MGILGFFVDGGPFEIEGMHPEKFLIPPKLPGMGPCTLIKQKAEEPRMRVTFPGKLPASVTGGKQHK